MWDFSFSKSIGLMLRTLPFIMLRLLVYTGITLAYILFTGGGAMIGHYIDRLGSNDSGDFAFLGMFFGFSLVSGMLYFTREYLLYLIKAGHIAVLVPLLDGQPIPEGKSQIRHAARVVKTRFIESSVLFGIDQLIKGILHAFNRTVMTVASLLPIPALERAMKFVTAVINMSLTYVDEVILAYNIRTQQENPWAGARDGVVLYAQNYKTLLKNALWLTVFVWLFTILIFVVVFAPVVAVIELLPGSSGFWGFVFAVITAYALKASLVDPMAMTCLMQAYFKVIEGQVPRQDWADKLSATSAKFKELSTHALNFSRQTSGGPRPA